MQILGEKILSIKKLALLLILLLPAIATAAPPLYPAVKPNTALVFPRDHGAHLQYRTEWWYVTGWVETAEGEPTESKPLGFQVTFFRTRPNIDQANPSQFSPKQLLFAHAAISDPAQGSLLHDQRSARSGFELAQASEADTDVRIDQWTLQREPTGRYTTHIQAREFELQLSLQPTQALLLQGDQGYSRKGKNPSQASYYYSQPQLAVSGTITRAGKKITVRGTAWLDHEWSTSVLTQEAAGWDWVGLNLDNGSALMAFRIRDAAGQALWASGTLRDTQGRVRALSSQHITFTPTRHWRSPRTATNYPVAMQVQAGDLQLQLNPLMEDQELDSRASTGAVYWEGAVTALQNGQRVGRGYLELTGYFKPLKF